MKSCPFARLLIKVGLHFFENSKGWNVQPFPFKNLLTHFYPLAELVFMNLTSKAEFEKKAFKILPFLIGGKILFAVWFVNHLVKL